MVARSRASRCSGAEDRCIVRLMDDDLLAQGLPGDSRAEARFVLIAVLFRLLGVVL